MSSGISILQGSHHVAQKFTRTTLPLYCATLTSFPSRLLITICVGPPFALALCLHPAPTAIRTATSKNPKILFSMNESKPFYDISRFQYTAAPNSRLLSAGYNSLQPENECVQRSELARKPR